MEKNMFDHLEELHAKSWGVMSFFESLPEKDIRRKHLEVLSSEITSSLVTLKICFRFTETNSEEFEHMLNNDTAQIDNYIHNFKQSILESIFDTSLFQTELVLRILYGKLTNQNPAKESSINKIIATLFDDVENNWQKEEARVLVLFWTMRNTIHTGGIYFKKPEGYTVMYRGKEYRFEYMKGFQFLDDWHLIQLFSDFLDSLKYLFGTEKIEQLGTIEHPSYYALGYS